MPYVLFYRFIFSCYHHWDMAIVVFFSTNQSYKECSRSLKGSGGRFTNITYGRYKVMGLWLEMVENLYSYTLYPLAPHSKVVNVTDPVSKTIKLDEDYDDRRLWQWLWTLRFWSVVLKYFHSVI